jgi:hypothetical protein
MVLALYTNGDRSSTDRRRSFGTAHAGSGWTNAVRLLRAAIHIALQNGTLWRRSSITTNTVGSAIIDSIGELDRASVNVLAIVFATLLKASRDEAHL